MAGFLVVCVSFLGSILLSLDAVAAVRPSEEPSYEQAVVRWPDMRRPIAFLGCKDHLDEFAVMWNGNLSLTTVIDKAPADRRLFSGRRDDSLQVSFAVGENPNFEDRDIEDASTEPSLAEGYLPMTRVLLKKGGAVLLQEAFAASEEGTCTVNNWDAPVFLHVRLTVQEPGAGSSPIRLWAQMAANHISYSMETRRNIRIPLVAPAYRRALHAADNALLDSHGLAVMLAGQSFRFYQQLPDSLSSIALKETQLDKNVAEFTLARKPGAVLDLIFPFLAVPQRTLLSVGRPAFEERRKVVTDCWKAEMAHGMQVGVPEAPLNNLWRFSTALSFIAADLYPNGDRVLKTSSHRYEASWPTPTAMNLQILAQRGYFKEVAAYLASLLDPERRRPPAGPNFVSIKGFISGPPEYLAVSWVGDHGAILWAASEYYLLSRDEAFLRRWLPTLLDGLEWIARERENTRLFGRVGAGLMPPGRANDAEMQSNFVWIDAWIYRGLDGMCRLLQAIGHADAPRWLRERDDYRATFQKAFRAQVQRTVRWTDRSGAAIPFVPWDLHQSNAENLHTFYLDTGPMVLGVFGLLEPGDETMTWAIKWLNEGPYAGRAAPDWANFRDPPSLRFEMSTAEPCYSWNVYLRFLRDERPEFLEGFYSQAAGAVSRKFLGAMETRDGIPNVPAGNAVIDNHLRNMLVFEDQAERGLHLLRNSPRAWLRPGQHIRVEGAQTHFGPMSYEVVAASDQRVQIEVTPPSRESLDWLRVHLQHPHGRALRRATVNGAAVVPTSAATLEIKNPSGRLKIIVEF